MNLRSKLKIGLFGVGCLMVVGMGVAITTYVMSGALILGGFVALVESVPPLKWLAERSTRGIDLLIFAASAVALFSIGPTVAIGMSVAGLGYTLVYAPHLRSERRRKVLEAASEKRKLNDSTNSKIH